MGNNGGAAVRSALARLDLKSYPGITRTATIPSVAVCGAYPMVSAPLVAAGAAVAVGVIHGLLWMLAPLNLIPLWINFRRHRNPSGLLVAGVGALLMFGALSGHSLPILHDFLIWIGLALLAAAILIDWRARRRAVSKPGQVLIPRGS